MFGKKKKMEAEIARLMYRVAELEERLCPCEQHKWIITRTEYDVGTSPRDITTYYTYKCKRCGKTKRTMDMLPTWKEGADHEAD